jgi:hypothetical protein
MVPAAAGSSRRRTHTNANGEGTTPMNNAITQGNASGRSQLELALALARSGVRVAPALLVPLGPTVATLDAEHIRACWSRWPDALVAVDLPGIGLFTPDPWTEGGLLPHQLSFELKQTLAKIGVVVWGVNEQGGYSEPCTLYINFDLVRVDPDQIKPRRR